jgi:hypothetical protein
MRALLAQILHDKAIPKVAVPFAPGYGTQRTKIQISINLDS